MAEALILHEAELRRLAGFDGAALDAVEGAFTALAEGRATLPPIMHLEVRQPPGDIDIKSATIEGLPTMAVKIGAGFFGNRLLDLPSSTAMMVVISTRTGQCQAVLLDNGYLTDLRTALAGAVAARHLARPGALAVGVLGAGAQARYQVEALAIEGRVRSVAVWAPRAEAVADYVRDMAARLAVPVVGLASAEAVVAASDLIVTTTPAKAAVLHGAWLRPGQHVTAMGSDLPGKRELDARALARADLLVCDSIAQSERFGELQWLAGQPGGRIATLGDVALGRVAGRTANDEITICDLSGIGVQDTAIADHVMRRAALRADS